MITNKDFMLCGKITEEELPKLKGEWEANIKFDGERIVAIKKGEDVFLLNRANREKSFIYPEIAEELKTIKGDFILDGEIITEDNLFNSLQHRSHLGSKAKVDEAIKKYPIKFMIFDIINLDGEDLRLLPLKNRIEILNSVNFPKLSKIEFVVYHKNISELLSFAKNQIPQLEGIVIKNMLSNYEGRRSNNWLKLKLFQQAELKVISYTINNAGLRLEDDKLNAVQVSGNQSDEVKQAIDNKGYCNIVIQYLEKTKNDKYRFISFVGVNHNER